MAAPAAVHPSEQTLQSYGLGKLDDLLSEAVAKHLAECASCRVRVEELTSDTFLCRLQEAQARSASIPPVGSSLPGMSKLDGDSRTPSPPPASTMPPGLAEHPDYQILRELGRGGMGVVYLAENRMMGRKEVLKVVGSHLLNRKGVLERFQREIRSAAQLHHPNIVTAYSATKAGESIVLAMQYVEGYDLSKLVEKSGPLQVAHACNFVYQAALGLQHAHERGMVHRDIKPSNLMLAREGNKPVIKILDFGLAKVTSEGAVDGGLTHEGQMLGTPHYVAPEQSVNAQQADIRADIYSLGCTLYCLLTGFPPFDAPSLYELLQAHHSMDAKPLNFIRPEVPMELAAVVAKMLAKEPERRYRTPGEVAKALIPFFKKGGVVPGGTKAEVSLAGDDGVKREPIAVGPGPTQPMMNPARSPESELKKSVGASKTQPTWEGRIVLEEEEPLLEAVPETAPDRRALRTTIAKACGLLLFGLLVTYAGWIIRIRLNNGVIELRDLPENARVFVDGDRVKVTIPGEGEPAEITVPPGDHRVEVKKDGFQVWGDDLSLVAGGSMRLSVRLVRDVAAKTNAGPASSIDTTSGSGIGGTMGLGQTNEAPRAGGKAASPKDGIGATSRPDQRGFLPLFNGKDLAGWKPNPYSPLDCIVDRGTLGTTSTGRLCTERGDYTDFHIRAELMVEANFLGSIFFRSEINDHAESTYAVRINTRPSLLPESTTGSFLLYKHGPPGDLAVLQAGRPDLVRPNEWFTLEVIALGHHFTVRINGQMVVEVEDPTRMYSRGHLALHHDIRSKGAEIYCRKFEVKELNGANRISGIPTGSVNAPAQGPGHQTPFVRQTPQAPLTLGGLAHKSDNADVKNQGETKGMTPLDSTKSQSKSRQSDQKRLQEPLIQTPAEVKTMASAADGGKTSKRKDPSSEKSKEAPGKGMVNGAGKAAPEGIAPKVPKPQAKARKNSRLIKTPATGRIVNVSLEKITSKPSGGDIPSALSPDSQRLIHPMWSHFDVFDLKTGNELVSIDFRQIGARAVGGKGTEFCSGVVSSDGNPVVRNADLVIRVLDKSTCKVIREFQPQLLEEDIGGGLWASGQDRIVGRGQLDIRFWDSSTGKPIKRWNARDVIAMDVSPRGNHDVVTIHNDHMIREWNVATGLQKGELPDATKRRNNIRFSRDGVRLLTWVSGETDFYLFDPDTAVEITFPGDHGKVRQIAAFPDAPVLASGDSDGIVRLWDENEIKRIHQQKCLAPVNQVLISPDGNHLVVTLEREIIFYRVNKTYSEPRPKNR